LCVRAPPAAPSQSPETKNDLSPAYEFNLMFATHIGPTGMLKGYMRPETAQGIFVNFRDLLYHNGGKLPFACAQIGQSFRNEIAPRAGLLRVREFTQAEIEHFVHPEHKEHPRFAEVANLTLSLFSQGAQLSESRAPLRMTIGDAVAQGIVANQTLGYFIARCYLFLLRLGVDETRLRFRQHLEKEMAHYAEDCWDAEIQCSYGWIECVGMADRSAFDLNAHAAKSKVDLTAYEKFPEPREVTELQVEPNKQLMGKELKKDAKAVTDALMALCEADALALGAKLAAEGSAQVAGCTISKEMVSIQKVTKMVSGRSFTPGVIEPSFGLGRIMYCLFEHSFYWCAAACVLLARLLAQRSCD
jgi:glycyl-tRNA synthetase